ncbi:unnamed protein product [Hyaloperonospora brassicae]|uniref:Elicitin-like protein n=1 Tax=Hyaloperonospora brassicae TaxID=162125 RepID=A0AAV0SZB7_HYABA|nr:unnamed protein product [Hyaloperonospora brassicae]
MKAVTSLPIAAVLTFAVVHAGNCNTASMSTLLTSSDVATCASGSGYSPSSLRTPTPAELETMCSDVACQTMLSLMTAMFPEECTHNTFALHAGLITPVTTHCLGSSNSSALIVAPTDTDLLASSASTTTSRTLDDVTSESNLTEATASLLELGAELTLPSGSSGDSVSAGNFSDATSLISYNDSTSLISYNDSTSLTPFDGSMSSDKYNDSTASTDLDEDVTVDASDSGSRDLSSTTAPPSSDYDSVLPIEKGGAPSDSDPVDHSNVPDAASRSAAGTLSSASLLGSAVVATFALFL